jgi:hypothetical protein
MFGIYIPYKAVHIQVERCQPFQINISIITFFLFYKQYLLIYRVTYDLCRLTFNPIFKFLVALHPRLNSGVSHWASDFTAECSIHLIWPNYSCWIDNYIICTLPVALHPRWNAGVSHWASDFTTQCSINLIWSNDSCCIDNQLYHMRPSSSTSLQLIYWCFTLSKWLYLSVLN